MGKEPESLFETRKNPPSLAGECSDTGFSLRSDKARRSAVNRSPASYRFVIPCCPICQIRKYSDARLKIKDECRFILEAYFNDVVVGRDVQFHASNDFSRCLVEPDNALVCFLSSAD